MAARSGFIDGPADVDLHRAGRAAGPQARLSETARRCHRGRSCRAPEGELNERSPTRLIEVAVALVITSCARSRGATDLSYVRVLCTSEEGVQRASEDVADSLRALSKGSRKLKQDSASHWSKCQKRQRE